ncbi:SLC13 family permease [Fusobacterium sp. PH5-44]|uniref:SLC13 family permease n=1 Tax=unclassified Fusobacterium TaxID=2648384 RepID=UPI003D1FB2F6
MNISILVILAIVIAITLGYITNINTGFFAIAFAYIIGCFFLKLKPADVIKMWPISIFFVIFSVSLFYNFALVNGTLEKLAMKLLYSCRKFPIILPLVIYFAATLVAGLGAGYFSVLAFFAPLTLMLCKKTGMNEIVGAISVNYGALAGANFMTSASGIIFRGLIDNAGYQEKSFSFATSIFSATFILPIVVISVLIFFTKKDSNENVKIDMAKPEAFDETQKKNLYLIFAMISLILIFPILSNITPNSEVIKFVNSKIDIGLIAIIFSIVAFMIKLAPQKDVIAKVPWNTLIMICGVGMLIQVAIKAGTIDMLSSWVQTNIPTFILPFVLAIIAGCMSFFSSTLGVVCPALFPIVPGIAANTGLNPALLFTAIIVGAQASSISPFSSGGSLILGSCSTEEERNKLFSQLLFKGIPICVTGGMIAALILLMVL